MSGDFSANAARFDLCVNAANGVVFLRCSRGFFDSAQKTGRLLPRDVGFGVGRFISRHCRRRQPVQFARHEQKRHWRLAFRGRDCRDRTVVSRHHTARQAPFGFQLRYHRRRIVFIVVARRVAGNDFRNAGFVRFARSIENRAAFFTCAGARSLYRFRLHSR